MTLRALKNSLPGPFTCGALVSLTVGLVQVGDLGDERVIGIWVGKHRADREQHLGDGKRGTPLIPEDVETNAAVAVDIGVVDLGGERDLGGLEGVVGGEGDGEEEDTAGVGRVTWAHDCCLPLEHVIAGRASTARRGRITPEVGELLVDPFHSHFLQSQGQEPQVTGAGSRFRFGELAANRREERRNDDSYECRGKIN